MVRLALGQPREAGAVEVDAVVVDEVRILLLVHPRGAEIDLARLLVHLRHAAHHPLALRDLVLHRAIRPVIEIEVVPAVALRHPDHLLAVAHVEPVLLARVAEEGGRLLGDDGPGPARGGLGLDDAVDLVPPLVVFERDGRAVLAPGRRRRLVGVGEQPVVDVDLPARGSLEHHRLLDVEHVARLGVEPGRVLRLELVLGRRLDVVDQPPVPRLHAKRGDPCRVRRPADGVEFVAVVLGSIHAQTRPGLLADVADHHVVVGDERLALPVR